MKSTVILGPSARVVFDWDAFNELRKQAQEIAIDQAEDLAQAASSYPKPAATKKYEAKKGPNIAAVVVPATTHARRSNAKHNTLVKLLGERSR